MPAALIHPMAVYLGRLHSNEVQVALETATVPAMHVTPFFCAYPMTLRNIEIKHQKRAGVVAYECAKLIALKHVPILTINHAARRS